MGEGTRRTDRAPHEDFHDGVRVRSEGREPWVLDASSAQPANPTEQGGSQPRQRLDEGSRDPRGGPKARPVPTASLCRPMIAAAR